MEWLKTEMGARRQKEKELVRERGGRHGGEERRKLRRDVSYIFVQTPLLPLPPHTPASCIPRLIK
jgi:hypothetical protein